MTDSGLPLIIIKVGGSLFEMPDLVNRLHPLFFSTQSRVAVVFGGGRCVDEIRSRASRGLLDDQQAHWESIDQMSVSAISQSSRWDGMKVLNST